MPEVLREFVLLAEDAPLSSNNMIGHRQGKKAMFDHPSMSGLVTCPPKGKPKLGLCMEFGRKRQRTPRSGILAGASKHARITKLHPEVIPINH